MRSCASFVGGRLVVLEMHLKIPEGHLWVLGPFDRSRGLDASLRWNSIASIASRSLAARTRPCSACPTSLWLVARAHSLGQLKLLGSRSTTFVVAFAPFSSRTSCLSRGRSMQGGPRRVAKSAKRRLSRLMPVG